MSLPFVKKWHFHKRPFFIKIFTWKFPPVLLLMLPAVLFQSSYLFSHHHYLTEQKASSWADQAAHDRYCTLIIRKNVNNLGTRRNIQKADTYAHTVFIGMFYINPSCVAVKGVRKGWLKNIVDVSGRSHESQQNYSFIPRVSCFPRASEKVAWYVPFLGTQEVGNEVNVTAWSILINGGGKWKFLSLGFL